MTAPSRFDLLGPLPTGTTLLEASAGTGKTYTIAALATRYIAEGVTTIDQMLMITFGRSATRELRERVREALTQARDALRDGHRERRRDPTYLLALPPDETRSRRGSTGPRGGRLRLGHDRDDPHVLFAFAVWPGDQR